jgi:metal-responsive CopG/Arc/MetJ family transcriptional regulator
MRSVVSISLPEKMASELDRFAKKTGRNKSDVIKEALGTYLWEERFKKSKAVLGERARKAGILTEEDVYKAVS